MMIRRGDDLKDLGGINLVKIVLGYTTVNMAILLGLARSDTY